MKKFIIFLLLLSIKSLGSQPQYVTTIHPFKEIIKAVVGERAEVYGMLPPGASPHTYELRPSDIRKVEAATGLIIGGKNLDDWALKFKSTHKIELINLVLKNFLIHIGNDKNVNDENSPIEEQSHHHAHGVDPHFWTDPLTVKAILPALTDSLCALDPAGCEIYQQNSKVFAQRLDSLHAKMNELFTSMVGKSVMLSHPFFQYFLKRYGFHVAGMIEKIPGREPSPKDIKEIIQQVNREKVQAIFTHPQLPDRASKLVAEATGIKVYELDPLGGVAGRQTYDELLMYNAKIVFEALQ